MDESIIKDVYLKRKSFQSLEVDDSDIQLKYLLNYIPADKNISILDAGCGNGKRALKLFSLGYTNITGVDLFDTIPVKEIIYKKARIEELPFPDKSFEFIYSMSVIYYPKDSEAPIKEFNRVLKEDGVLLFTAHTKYSLFTLRRVIMRILGRKVVNHLRDVKFKSAGEYVELLKQNNFDIMLVDGFNLSYILVPFYGFLGKVLLKLFRIELPQVRQHITSNRLMARIKSVFAYHMVIVARKRSS